MNITKVNFTTPASVTGLTASAGQIVVGASTGGLTASTPGANGTVLIYDNTQVSGLNATASPSLTTLAVSGLISANGGITVATGQAATLSGTATLTIGSGTLNSSGAITTSGNLSTTGTGTVTSAGLLTASGGVTVATGQTVTLSGTAALTMGSGALTSTGAITTTGVITGQTIIAGVNIRTNASTTPVLALADANALISSTNAATQTFTIPTNASVAYPVGTTLTFTQEGAGKVTLAPAGGVTFRTFNSFLSTAGVNATITAAQIVANTWLIYGNLGA